MPLGDRWEELFATAFIEQDIITNQSTEQASEKDLSSSDGQTADPGMEDEYFEDWIYEFDELDSAEIMRNASIIR